MFLDESTELGTPVTIHLNAHSSGQVRLGSNQLHLKAELNSSNHQSGGWWLRTTDLYGGIIDLDVLTSVPVKQKNNVAHKTTPHDR